MATSSKLAWVTYMVLGRTSLQSETLSSPTHSHKSGPLKNFYICLCKGVRMHEQVCMCVYICEEQAHVYKHI